MVKQAALALVKRTLERCHKFEDTGKSCFSEPLFREMFISGFSDKNLPQLVDGNIFVQSQEAQVSGSFLMLLYNISYTHVSHLCNYLCLLIPL